MVKGVVSREDKPREENEGVQVCGVNGEIMTAITTPQVHSSSSVKNFAPPHHDTRSASRPELQAVMDAARSFLSAGQGVSEVDLFEIFSPPRRFLKGDCLRALRLLKKSYPRRTRLVLIGGVYVLIPVAPEVSP
jgi:hypothetical protein